MTTEAMIGSGTTVELSDGSSPEAYVLLGEVGDLDIPSDETDLVDVTHMQSGRREELISGIIRGGEGTIPMNYIPGSVTDDLIVAMVASGEARNIRFTYPNLVTETFECLPRNYSRRVPVGDKMQSTLTIKKTGDTTYGVTT